MKLFTKPYTLWLLLFKNLNKITLHREDVTNWVSAYSDHTR